jgi:hypothetical protein
MTVWQECTGQSPSLRYDGLDSKIGGREKQNEGFFTVFGMTGGVMPGLSPSLQCGRIGVRRKTKKGFLTGFGMTIGRHGSALFARPRRTTAEKKQRKMGVNKNDGRKPFAMRSLRFLRARRASRRYAKALKRRADPSRPKAALVMTPLLISLSERNGQLTPE